MSWKYLLPSLNREGLGVGLEQFQTREPHRLRLLGRLVGLLAHNQGNIAGYELIGRATTAADDVDEPLVDKLPHLRSHRLGRLIVEA